MRRGRMRMMVVVALQDFVRFSWSQDPHEWPPIRFLHLTSHRHILRIWDEAVGIAKSSSYQLAQTDATQPPTGLGLTTGAGAAAVAGRL